MSNLCSVLETLYKNLDSESEDSDNDNDIDDDALNGSSNSRLSCSNSWKGSVQKLPTTPSTNESDLANLSTDSDFCRQCGKSRAQGGPQWGRLAVGRGRSRERNRGSDRESERESDRDSLGGSASDRPPLPSRSGSGSRSHVRRGSRSRSRRPGAGPPSSPTSPGHVQHTHSCSLDTDCSSDQDKHSDSSAFGSSTEASSSGGLLRNKRTSRKPNKSVGFTENPPPPSPHHQTLPPPPPPPPPPPQGPPSSPLPDRTNRFRPITRPNPGPLRADHELVHLVPASSSGSSQAVRDRERRPAVRKPRARSSEGSEKSHTNSAASLRNHSNPESSGSNPTASEGSEGKSHSNSVLNRVSAFEALNCSAGSGLGRPKGGISNRNGDGTKQTGLSDSGNGTDGTAAENGESPCSASADTPDKEPLKTVNGRARSASVDGRKRSGLSLGVASTHLLPSSPVSPSSSFSPSPTSSPSPGFSPGPGFSPSPTSTSLPRYEEAVERLNLLRWASLQKLPTSKGATGTCGGRADVKSWISRKGSDDVFTDDDDVTRGGHDVKTAPVPVTSGQNSSVSRLESRRTSTSKRIVLEVLV